MGHMTMAMTTITSSAAATTAILAVTGNNNWCIRDGCDVFSGGSICREEYRSRRSRRHGNGGGGHPLSNTGGVAFAIPMWHL